MSKKKGGAEAELVENFLVIWDLEEGSKLYKMGFFGKPIGIPKPKSTDLNAPLILDLMEGLYLLEKKLLTVVEGPMRREVDIEELRARARGLYDDFDLKYAVYRDLRGHGLIVTPGIKYGCDFVVYKRGPGLEHAPYMVSVKEAESEITATEVVRTGRLATSVKKRFIVAVPRPGAGSVQYLIFKWFKA